MVYFGHLCKWISTGKGDNQRTGITITSDSAPGYGVGTSNRKKDPTDFSQSNFESMNGDLLMLYRQGGTRQLNLWFLRNPHNVAQGVGQLIGAVKEMNILPEYKPYLKQEKDTDVENEVQQTNQQMHDVPVVVEKNPSVPENHKKLTIDSLEGTSDSLFFYDGGEVVEKESQTNFETNPFYFQYQYEK